MTGLKKVDINEVTGIKTKYEISFPEFLTELVVTQYEKAKLPTRQVFDFQTIPLKQKSQQLVMMHDLQALRQVEKNKLTSQLQTVYFASIAHDLRTPLNSLLASNKALIQASPI